VKKCVIVAIVDSLWKTLIRRAWLVVNTM